MVLSSKGLQSSAEGLDTEAYYSFSISRFSSAVRRKHSTHYLSSHDFIMFCVFSNGVPQILPSVSASLQVIMDNNSKSICHFRFKGCQNPMTNTNGIFTALLPASVFPISQGSVICITLLITSFSIN